MKPFVSTIRAIGSEFIGRKLKSIGLLSVAIAFALTVLGLWLTTINAWWWVVMAIILVCDTLLVGTFIIGLSIVGMFRPEQTGEQKEATHRFVNRLERIAEAVQTPPYLILFYIARDVIRPRPTGFITELTADSGTVKKDLEDLIALHTPHGA